MGRMTHPYRMAHEDGRVRYLAHEQVQPVDRWEHDLLLVLGAIAFLLVLATASVLVP